MGRPLKFKTVKELQQKIDAYFESCWEDTEEGKKMIRPLTITGLALALDTTRDTLLDYEEKDGFSDTVKKAKQRVENFAEEQLFINPRTAGIIFNMVNNWGWQNKQETKQEVTIEDKTDVKERLIYRINEVVARKGETEITNKPD